MATKFRNLKYGAKVAAVTSIMSLSTEPEPPVSGSVDKDSRTRRLVAMLKQQQDVIYRQEDIAKYFSGDSELLHVASNCWQQIHGRVGGVIEEKYHKVLEEFKVVDKLSELDFLERTNPSSNQAWRPSGNPRDDFTQAAGAVIRVSAIPEFEKMYTEVQGVTSKLQELIQEKQQVLAALETQISHQILQLNTETDSLV